MWILIFFISYLLTQTCIGLDLIELPTSNEGESIRLSSNDEGNIPTDIFRRAMSPKPYPPTRKSLAGPQTKHWLFRQSALHDEAFSEDEKDLNIKTKIATLVQQTLHDTERKIKSITQLKTRNRELPPYRIGFILSMIKKARDVLNELFNVAVKHRDQWKALEQLKIFELIVHTNVDTTNLVRQLVEIHIQHLNSTSGTRSGKRVVLL